MSQSHSNALDELSLPLKPEFHKAEEYYQEVVKKLQAQIAAMKDFKKSSLSLDECKQENTKADTLFFPMITKAEELLACSKKAVQNSRDVAVVEAHTDLIDTTANFFANLLAKRQNPDDPSLISAENYIKGYKNHIENAENKFSLPIWKKMIAGAFVLAGIAAIALGVYLTVQSGGTLSAQAGGLVVSGMALVGMGGTSRLSFFKTPISIAKDIKDTALDCSKSPVFSSRWHD